MFDRSRLHRNSPGVAFLYLQLLYKKSGWSKFATSKGPDITQFPLDCGVIFTFTLGVSFNVVCEAFEILILSIRDKIANDCCYSLVALLPELIDLLLLLFERVYDGVQLFAREGAALKVDAPVLLEYSSTVDNVSSG